jgi:hypothetical protein
MDEIFSLAEKSLNKEVADSWQGVVLTSGEMTKNSLLKKSACYCLLHTASDFHILDSFNYHL